MKNVGNQSFTELGQWTYVNHHGEVACDLRIGPLAPDETPALGSAVMMRGGLPLCTERTSP